jgi:hypothetical protein
MMAEINEYDVVRLKHDLQSAGLKEGARGTVVMVYKVPWPAYEVEFTAAKGQTIALVTLEEKEIEVVWSAAESHT